MIEAIQTASRWAIPLFLTFILLMGTFRRVRVYEVFVEGAKEGFDTAIRILPYLLAMFVAIAVLRESGALDAFLGFVGPVAERIGIPREVLPLAVIRPLSGSGALGTTSDLMEAHGPDSLIGLLASTVQGSTETTLYVLTVYFGAVGIRRIRHTLGVGLAADITAFLASVYFTYLVFGS